MNDMMKIFFLAAVIWYFFINDSFMLSDLFEPTDVTSYDCERLANYFEGRSLQNIFGGSFKVLEINDVQTISRTEDRLRCHGTVMLSNGSRRRMSMQVYKSEKGRTLYEIRPI